jgi:hypothetical protein
VTPSTAAPPDAPAKSARAELERAQRELDASGDCVSACRALGSMKRATSHLCSLATEDEDRRRCEDAKKRLATVQDRVRSACGSCP